ncbi:DUF402 domain-containing protein [Ureibacillus sp. GCM10028918]|uniref:DUF402 domain-containing protein n=1 Tax=Ureibacillus sp. GCM10028918 TaxID=3273429 RepID=UPI00360C964D
MFKRKYGNRSNWKRVLKSEYQQTFHQDKDFRGYITLLNIEEVLEPLVVKNAGKEVCIVNKGYSWLQHFPIGKNHSVTTMFDAEGEVVQWYIDICHEIGIENNIPWMDDLYLDIVVFPTGEIIILDEDELDEALANGVIHKSMYDLAYKEARKVMGLIQQDKFQLIHLAKEHKEILTD